MTLDTARKNIYFASDIHLGYGSFEDSLKREKIVVKWLNEIEQTAKAIYFLGDVFDFWHEWRRSAPQGFTRFLGKLAEISDNGIEIHLFTGNHDIWIYDYLPREIGLKLYRKELKIELSGKKFYMAHGDGLGPGDRAYDLLKSVFTNKFLQWCFKHLLHPDFSLWIGQSWSNKHKREQRDPVFHGLDKEWLILHSKKELEKEHFDFFVYGHRHIPGIHQIGKKSKYINLGDWLVNFTYGVFNGEDFELKKYIDK